MMAFLESLWDFLRGGVGGELEFDGDGAGEGKKGWQGGSGWPQSWRLPEKEEGENLCRV